VRKVEEVKLGEIIKEWKERVRWLEDSVKGYSDVWARMDVVKMKIELPEEMIKSIREIGANLRKGLKPIVEGLDDMWKGLSGD